MHRVHALVLTLVAVALTLQVAEAATRPTNFRVSSDLSGLQQNNEPTLGTKNHFKRDFRHVNVLGRSTRLNYDIETAEELVNLNTYDNVNDIQCPGDGIFTMTVGDMTAAKADIVVGSILVGGAEWGCVSRSTGKVRAIMHSVESVTQLDANRLTVGVTSTPFASAIKGGTISFDSNERTKKTPPPSDAAGSGAQRRRASRNFLDKAGDAISNAADDVKDTVDNVVDTVKDVADGTFDAGLLETENLNYNYDATTGKAGDGSVVLFQDATSTIQCTNCFLNFESTVTFNMSVDNYAVTSFASALEGDLSATVENGADLIANVETTATVSLFDWVGPIWAFYIGPIPVVLQLDIPTTGRVDISSEARGKVLGSAEFGGPVKLGLYYDPTNDWQTVSDFSQLVMNSTISGLDFDGARAQVRVAITPRISLTIEGILDLWFDPTPFTVINSTTMTTDQQAAAGDSECDLGTSGTQFALDVYGGVQLSIGATIDLTILKQEIFHKDFAPLVVYENSQLLREVCFDKPAPATKKSRSLTPPAAGDRFDRTTFTQKGKEMERPLSAKRGLPSEVSFGTSGAKPYSCGASMCSGVGQCLNGVCKCFPGYQGEDCSEGSGVAFLREGRCKSNTCAVASGLVNCPNLNGRRLCVKPEDMMELDGNVRDIAASFLEASGPVCRDAIEPYLCSLLMPECSDAKTSDVAEVCFDTCTSTYEVCGLSPKFSAKICSISAASPYSNVARKQAVEGTGAGNTCIGVVDAGQSSGKCVQAPSKLQNCPHLAGKNLFLHTRSFATAKAADRYAGKVATASPLTKSSQCGPTAKSLMCAQFLPECAPGAGPNGEDTRKSMCHDTCVSAIKQCSGGREAVCDTAHTLGGLVAAEGDSQCSTTLFSAKKGGNGSDLIQEDSASPSDRSNNAGSKTKNHSKKKTKKTKKNTHNGSDSSGSDGSSGSGRGNIGSSSSDGVFVGLNTVQVTIVSSAVGILVGAILILFIVVMIRDRQGAPQDGNMHPRSSTHADGVYVRFDGPKN
eukprot:TRINITY_DN3680_c0_g1_i1.p1 TRINITY_DN3680_c0_g1~~TRINITY_DN3680_c0_g1_i1.p1  ORF type:complete len:1022 (-),score=189.16 TRINITY_DN3680_c0_g1_i1:75-3140(-)